MAKATTKKTVPAMDGPKLRLCRLSIKDFLGIEALDLEPGKLTRVTGANGSGKTTIEKALATIFGDRGELPEQPIRLGADEARVFVDLGDVTAQRVWDSKGTQLEVLEGGVPVERPSDTIKKLVNLASMSPLRLMTAHPNDQFRAVMSAIDVELTEEFLRAMLGHVYEEHKSGFSQFLGLPALESLQKVHGYLHEERRLARRELEQKRKAYDELAAEIPAAFDPGAESGSLPELMAQLNDARDFNRRREAAAADMKRIATDISAKQAEIEDLRTRIARLTDELVELDERKQAILNEWLEPDTGKGKPARETASLEARIAQLEADRKLAAKVEMRDRLVQEVATAEARWQGLEEAVVIVRDKAMPELMREADFPVAGLAITDGKLCVNGVPVEQLSTGEQLTFWLTVAAKTAGALKVLFLDNAELLDSAHMESVLAFARENADIQWFILEVSDGPLSVDVLEAVDVELNGDGPHLTAHGRRKVAAAMDAFAPATVKNVSGDIFGGE